MKNTILIVVIALNIFIFSNLLSSYRFQKEYALSKDFTKDPANEPEIDYIEYANADEGWLKIIHFTDGTIGVSPVYTPPFD